MEHATVLRSGVKPGLDLQRSGCRRRFIHSLGEAELCSTRVYLIAFFFFPLHRVTHNGLIHARHCLTGHLKRCPPLQNSPSPTPEAKNVPKVFHTREFDRLTLRASSVSFVYRSFTERTGPRKRTSPPCFFLSGQKKVVSHSSSCYHSVALTPLREEKRKNVKETEMAVATPAFFPRARRAAVF